MWRIDIDGEAVYSPDVGIAAGNPVLTQELNAADQLTFEVTPSHRLYDAIRAGVLTSRYIVYRDGSPVSYGRILAVETQPLNAVAKVTCEGELAYLNDAVLPAYDFGGTPADYLRMFVGEYVGQCGDDLQLGRVSIADSNDYIVRGNEMPTALLPELLDKTVNSTAGGVLRIRHEDGRRYLDWIAEPDTPGSQAIAKGSNLLNLSSVVDGAQLVTAVMPIGAEQEDGTLVRMPSGPDGLVSGNVWRRGDYLYNKALSDAYGWHAQVRQWEDVTLPPNLLTKAIAAVRALSPETTITASAVDLTDAGYNVDVIALGQSVPIECDDIATRLFVTGCEFHMDYPADSTYTFGKLAELTESVAVADSAGWTEPTVYAKKATVDGRLDVSGVVDLGNVSATGPYCRIASDTDNVYLTQHDSDGDLHQWRFNSATSNIAKRDWDDDEDAWGAWRTPNMQTGSVSVTPVSNNVVSIDITFPYPFSSIPKVFTQLQTGVHASLRYWNVGVTYVTETGFTLNVSNASTTLTTRTVQWIAIACL